MAQPGQDAAGKGDEYKILWVIALVFALCFIIWHVWKDELLYFFVAVRSVQLWILDAILTPFNAGFELRLAKEDFDSFLDTEGLSPRDITPEIAMHISILVGDYFRFPAILILVAFAVRLYSNHPHSRFCHKFNVNTLCESEKILWPQISPVLKLNLVNVDLDKGPWAMAMSPMHYCKKNKLITTQLVKPTGGLSQDYKFRAVLNKNRTALVLSQQLGRPWQGFAAMPPQRKAIVAVLFARGCRDTKKAQELINQFSISITKGELDLTGVDALWAKHEKHPQVQRICKQHAYELTLTASALQFAREDGVVASADFLWVKPIDRIFWYTLNSIGRQTPFVEVAGVFAHWITECAIKRPLSVPMIQEAVIAMEIATDAVIYVPDEEERQRLIDEATKMENS
ncbi:MAG: type IVB secretion system coupling complex protein DotM/IcmP [Gammaproteobacteria bacterium]